ncbi:MAG: NADP-dependent oxidoreductase [Vulcanimicrobiaceae bacterium]
MSDKQGAKSRADLALRSAFVTALRSREIRLVRRPSGYPAPDDMALVETDVRAPGDGEIVVRNALMSVDPYMRGRMNEGKSYVPPFELDAPMGGAAVGTVVASRAPAIPEGSLVLHTLGWRDYAVLPARYASVVDAAVATPSAYLGILGVTGLTAWVGLLDIAGFAPGETLFVSAASGAVGSIAGQLAKLHGAKRVVGSAGSKEKAAYLCDVLGFDAAFDYKSGDVADLLREAAPDGINVYFDNVGGVQLEAALAALQPFGRIAACGMISTYNEKAPGPRNIQLIVGKRLRMQGFIVLDHENRRSAFLADVVPALRDGRIKAPETFVDGLESAPQALVDMLHGGGKHLGKVIVRIP